jgi:hypothetical protein
MKTRIKISYSELDEEGYDLFKSDLEKMIKMEPDEKIKENSKKMNWTIDEKNIIVGNDNSKYRIDFYHHDKEDGKKSYLGSMNYHPVEFK